MLPLLAIRAEPLELRIEAPRKIRSGETLAVKVWLVNTSSKPVVVVNPSPINYELGVGFEGELFRDKPVATRLTKAQWRGQWMRAREYDADAFATIAPGHRLAVEDSVCSKEYVSGKRPSLISELETSPQIDLPPGEYTYKAVWGFKPSFGKRTDAEKRWNLSQQTLSPEARRLYARTWIGRLSAQSPVTVLPK